MTSKFCIFSLLQCRNTRQDLIPCLPSIRPTLISPRLLPEITNRLLLCPTVPPQNVFYFRQEDLDFALFGYTPGTVSTASCSHGLRRVPNVSSSSPCSHALSGLKIGTFSNGRATSSFHFFLSCLLLQLLLFYFSFFVNEEHTNVDAKYSSGVCTQLMCYRSEIDLHQLAVGVVFLRFYYFQNYLFIHSL